MRLTSSVPILGTRPLPRIALARTYAGPAPDGTSSLSASTAQAASGENYARLSPCFGHAARTLVLDEHVRRNRAPRQHAARGDRRLKCGLGRQRKEVFQAFEEHSSPQ